MAATVPDSAFATTAVRLSSEMLTAIGFAILASVAACGGEVGLDDDSQLAETEDAIYGAGDTVLTVLRQNVNFNGAQTATGAPDGIDASCHGAFPG